MRLVTKAASLLGAATLGASAWATHMLTRKGVKTTLDSAFFYTPFELGIPYAQVSFYNSEGLRLNGWWLENEGTDKVIVLCPGYGRSKSDLLGVGSRLWRAGYRVLLFDFRDQGESEQAIATIGHFERDDLESALDFVQWHVQGAEIGLVGYSMGAAVSIMAATHRPEVRAVVADSSFADLRKVLRNIFKYSTHLPPSPSMELAEMLIWLRAGYRFSTVRPVDYVARLAPRPLLIIHGDTDNIAPVEDAYALFAAAGEPKELWVTPETNHCGTYFVDRDRYVRKVVGFFRNSLGDPLQAAPTAEQEIEPEELWAS